MLQLLRARRFAPLFWTQLFGAFNDNFFKSALVVTLTFGALSSTSWSIDSLVNLSTALLVLPFFLFSALAGQLADRFDKATLIRGLKVSELCVMVLALVGFSISSLPLLFAALFMMGTQSAFFGPVKYAILPQHLEDDELLGANGLVEMGTFVAILGGTIVGALVVALPGIGVPLVGACLIAVSLLGMLSARFVPAAPPSVDAPKVDWNLVRGTVETIRIGRKDRGVWRAILGASWFWGVGAFVLGQMPRLAETLGGDERALTWMLSAFSVGIAIGSVLCEKLNAGRIEVGRVPLAGVLMSVSLVALAYATTITWACVALATLGFFGGMFIVPLYAFMQHHAEAEERSRVIAANNIVNAAFMVGAAIYAMVRLGSVSLSWLIVEVAILHGVATLVAAVFVHRALIRLTIRRIVRTMYRVDASGLDAIPAEGAAVVVANHQSFIDAFILGGLSQREIRFVMDHRMANLPGMAWFFRLTGAIPIASRKDNPELLKRAFEDIDAALANGELVGIFPEGMCTRDGQTNEFKPGVEKILARRPVPVVPIALDGLWGSFFSYRHGYPMKSFPRRFWSKIRVAVGAPRPPEVSADELREVVERLRAGAG